MLRRLTAARATEKRGRAYALCAFFFRHIFAAAGNLRFPLSQPQKRHIQPRRYTPFFLKIYGKTGEFKVSEAIKWVIEMMDKDYCLLMF
jgi:hypothetical protein